MQDLNEGSEWLKEKNKMMKEITRLQHVENFYKNQNESLKIEKENLKNEVRRQTKKNKEIEETRRNDLKKHSNELKKKDNEFKNEVMLCQKLRNELLKSQNVINTLKLQVKIVEGTADKEINEKKRKIEQLDKSNTKYMKHGKKLKAELKGYKERERVQTKTPPTTPKRPDILEYYIKNRESITVQIRTITKKRPDQTIADKKMVDFLYGLKISLNNKDGKSHTAVIDLTRPPPMADVKEFYHSNIKWKIEKIKPQATVLNFPILLTLFTYIENAAAELRF